MTRKDMANHWQYRIEPYRRIPGEAAWSPVPEDRAEVWFGFRDKGEDRRCFGVFPSRADAEKAMESFKERDQPGATQFQQILKGGNPPERKPEEKQMDKGREM